MTSPTISAWRRSSAIKVSFADIGLHDICHRGRRLQPRGAPLRRSAGLCAGHRGGAPARRRAHVPSREHRERARRARRARAGRDRERPLRGADRDLDAGRAQRARGRRAPGRRIASCCASRARPSSAAACIPTRPSATSCTSRRSATRRSATRCAGSSTRTPTGAVHVHVGMPDPETAIVVYNRLRAYLPLLQALAAHSPFWHGKDSGLASARALTFRAFPRSTIPPPFANWADYEELVELVRGDRRDRRLHVPVVGHPAEPEPRARSRCARWTRRRG